MYLKVKIYKSVVTLSLLCGAKTWAIKVDYIEKLNRKEMRYLQATISHSLLEHMTNEYIGRQHI
jgi:hypothetical protein